MLIMRQNTLLLLIFILIAGQSIVSAHNHGLSIVDPPDTPIVLLNGEPVSNPNLLCADELTDVVISVENPEPGTTYDWTFPASIDLGITFDDDNIRSEVRIPDMSALNTSSESIFAFAENSCGRSAIPAFLGFRFGNPVNIPGKPVESACTNAAFSINPSDLNVLGTNLTYEWDFPGATLLSGNPDAGTPFEIEYDQGGNFFYSVTVTNNQGCSAVQTFELQLLDSPPMPLIIPVWQMNTTDLVFTWKEVPGFTYTVDIVATSTGWTSQTFVDSLVISNIPRVGDAFIVTVTATGTNPAPCDVSASVSVGRACEPVIIEDIISQVDFCLDDPVSLQPVVLDIEVAGELNPVDGRWETATGLDLSSGTPMFNPIGLPTGKYELNYVFTNSTAIGGEGCEHRHSVDFEIVDPATLTPQVTVTGTMTDPVTGLEVVCGGGMLMVTTNSYSSKVDQSIFITTNNGTADRLSSTEYEITVDDVTQDIIITVERAFGNCIIDNSVTTLGIVAKPVLEIICSNAGIDSIDIAWSDIGEAPYELYINGAIEMAGLTDTFITLSNLPLDTEFDFEIRAESSFCGSIIGTSSCRTESCVAPQLTQVTGYTDFENNILDTICYAGSELPYELSATLVGLPLETIDFEFTGANVEANNMLMPIPGQDVYPIKLVYNRVDGCTGEFDLEVVFRAQPVAQLVLPDTLCLGTPGLIRSDYIDDDFHNWDLGLAVQSGGNIGSSEITLRFIVPGDYPISLTIDDEGCSNAVPFTGSIHVTEPPVFTVECVETGLDTIQLVWDNAGTNYEVFVESQ